MVCLILYWDWNVLGLNKQYLGVCQWVIIINETYLRGIYYYS